MFKSGMLKLGTLKRLALMALVAISAAGASVEYAEAARLGGGRSTGMQRSIPQRQAMPPAVQRPSPAAPAAAPASGWRKWAGPLAGLAAGIGLASLFSSMGMGGLGGGIGSMLMMLAVGAVVFMLVRRFMASRQPQQPAMAGSAPSWQQQPAQFEAQQGYGGGAATYDEAPAANIPADFDVDGFTRQAKVSFIRLQASNDAGNLDDIREFTSPEMFAEVKMDIDERRGAKQKTDVVSLEAQVIEVAEDGARYIASVRFHGLLREDANSAPAPFDEVWHLSKPRSGGGWMLSGIQQVS